MYTGGIVEVRGAGRVRVQANGAVRVYDPDLPVDNGGAISFNGSSTYLSAPASADWAPGTGDFTVEWWQYQTDSSAYPRIFSVGSYPAAAIGVSIESTTF